MAESTLSITRTDIRRAIGRYLPIARTPASWLGTDTDTDVNDIIKSGERNFYRPPILPGERMSHTWSFLEPVLDLAIISAQTSVPLPADFGGYVDNSLTFALADDEYHKIVLTDISTIRSLRQTDTNVTPGQPR